MRAIDKHLAEAVHREVSAIIRHLDRLTDSELRATGGGSINATPAMPMPVT
jgi:hypothetical protein